MRLPRKILLTVVIVALIGVGGYLGLRRYSSSREMRDDLYTPTIPTKACSTATDDELKSFNAVFWMTSKDGPCRPDAACSTATGLMRERGACVPDIGCSRAPKDLYDLDACLQELCSAVSEEYFLTDQRNGSAFSNNRFCIPDIPCSQASLPLKKKGACIKDAATGTNP